MCWEGPVSAEGLCRGGTDLALPQGRGGVATPGRDLAAMDVVHSRAAIKLRSCPVEGGDQGRHENRCLELIRSSKEDEFDCIH